MSHKCPLCHSKSIKPSYKGKMRHSGRFTDYDYDHTVFQCSNCSVEFINPFPEAVSIENEYTVGSYWNKKGCLSYEELQKIDDKSYNEAINWMNIVDGSSLNQQIRLLDFGCGIGGFLDLSKSLGCMTYGIELDINLVKYCSSKGHQVYSSLDSMKSEVCSFDVITSFDVFEHLVNPIEALESLLNLAHAGSILYLGIPNQNDIIKSIEPRYLSHFYHVEHLWYFNEESIRFIMNKLNLRNFSFHYLHKYNLMNLVEWVRLGKAPGLPDNPHISLALDQSFRSSLELDKTSSHFLVKIVI